MGPSSYDVVEELRQLKRKGKKKKKRKEGELFALLNSHERCTSCKGVLLQCIINALANHFSITYLLWQDLK